MRKGKIAITIGAPAAADTGRVQQALYPAVSDPPGLVHNEGVKEYLAQLAAVTMHAMASDLYNPAVRCVTLVVEMDLPEQ